MSHICSQNLERNQMPRPNQVAELRPYPPGLSRPLLSFPGTNGETKYQLVTCNILQFAMKKVQNTKANSIKLDNPY